MKRGDPADTFRWTENTGRNGLERGKKKDHAKTGNCRMLSLLNRVAGGKSSQEKKFEVEKGERGRGS